MSLIFCVCMGLRLARFNTNLRASALTQQPGWKKDFFTGVPAPASAFISLCPLSLYLATGQKLFINPVICSLFMVGAGILAISRLPTYSFKNTQIPRKMVPLAMLLVGGVVAALLSDLWLTFSFLILIYLITIPFSVKNHRQRLKSFLASDEQEMTGKSG